ncbi:MAG: nucleotidyltransferase domain-containing protein [Syntrophobacteraceae bacterium]|jgi:predicted nucleotidyltransferase
MAVIDTVIEERARRAVSTLGRAAKVRRAYLFGSCIEGTADTYSDIDLAVFIEGLEEWDLAKMAKTSAAVQKEVGDDVELHYFPAAQLSNPQTASFAAFVISHGRSIAVDNS